MQLKANANTKKELASKSGEGAVPRDDLLHPKTVFPVTVTCARRAISGEMGKSNDDLSVPSRRRMACDMSHIFCATVPLWI